MDPCPDMMLKFRSLPPRRGNLPSTLTCSNSLPAQLQQTCCGRAIRSLENVVPAHAKHFKLPTVIITGCRGHGKFFTLENLVKKRIFPRECEFCINMAIRLRLRAVNEGSPPSVTLTCPSSAPLVLPSESYLPAELAQVFERPDETESAAEPEVIIDICQVQHML